MEPAWKSRREKDRGFWSQSGAGLRETKEEQTEGSSLKGSLKRLENAYGSIEFGVDEKGRAEISVARKTGYKEPGLRSDQKGLDRTRRAPVKLGGAVGYTDSHHKEDSAIIWTEKSSLPPERVMEELRRLARHTRQKTLTGMIPGLEERSLVDDMGFRDNLLKKVKRNLTEVMEEGSRTKEQEPGTEKKRKKPALSPQKRAEADGTDEKADGTDEKADETDERAGGGDSGGQETEDTEETGPGKK